MARHKEGTFDAIASMPWPVGLVLGIVAHIGVRYGGSRLLSASENPFLSAFGKELDKGTIQIIAWLLLGVCWLAAFCSFFVRRKRSRLLDTQTGLESLRAMDWRQFEMLVGEGFRRQGYRTEETGLGGADGGIDLLLSRDGGTTLVQCKQWRGQRVDVKVVREMYGLLAHHGADSVKIVAIGDFTPDARRFAQGKPIELIHGDALLAMIRGAQASPARRAPPVIEPTQANATPICPRCGALMVKRTNRRTGCAFWGCPQYPSCRGTRTA